METGSDLGSELTGELPINLTLDFEHAHVSGYFAWRSRLACRHQRDDMVLLAHVRSAFALSNSTYGSPRMTRELRDSGLTAVRTPGRRLGNRRPAASGPGSRRSAQSPDHAPSGTTADPPFG